MSRETIIVAAVLVVSSLLQTVFQRSAVQDLKEEIAERDRKVEMLLQQVNDRNRKISQFLITQQALSHNIDSLLDDRLTAEQRTKLEQEALQYILNQQANEPE